MLFKGALFQNVGAGQIATLQLPVGMTYDAFNIGLDIDGTPATLTQFAEKVKEVRLYIEAELKQQLTGTEFIKLFDGYYGTKSAPGSFLHPLSFKDSRSIATEDLLGYGTKDVQSMRYEIEFAEGDYTPKITRFTAETREGQNLGKHLVRKRQYINYSGAAGECEIDSIVRGPHALVALHLQTDKVSELEVEANSVRIWNQSTRDVSLLQSFGRTCQTGFFHVDFAYNGRPLSSSVRMSNLQDFRLRATMTGEAPSIAILSERIEERTAS